MQKLMSVFKTESPGQLIVIFVVFAVTGSAAVYAAGPILDFVGINSETLPPLVFWPLRILVIFPIYQCLLIIIGTMAGQFKYFWEFEKSFFVALEFGSPKRVEWLSSPIHRPDQPDDHHESQHPLLTVFL